MACSKPPYAGPVSDHWDGKRFSAPDPIRNKTFWDILKWRVTAQKAQWPDKVDYGPTDRPPTRVDNGGELRVSFVNHATVLLQTRGLNILTDPVWSYRVSPFSFIGPHRVNPPGIAMADLPKIDIVLISHSHYDHLDIETVKTIAKRDNPQFIVPLGVDAIIRDHAPDAKMHVMDWHQDYAFSDTLRVHCVPSQHWSSRWIGDRNKTLWAGYVLDLPDGKIYFAGDTGYASGKIFKAIGEKFGAMRFALIPIGAYEPRWFMKDAHVRPDESLNIFRDVRAEKALGIHWGTFQLTDEGIDEPIRALEQVRAAADIAPDNFRTLNPGQSWVLN